MSRGASGWIEVVRADVVHAGAQWTVIGRILGASTRQGRPLPPGACLQWFRVAHALWQRRWTRPLALWGQARVLAFSGAEIHPAARIGPGFLLTHSAGVVVGADAVLVRDVVLHQGVALGNSSAARPGQPRLGDGVRVGVGAPILGPVVVGDGVEIRAHSPITRERRLSLHEGRRVITTGAGRRR